MDGWTNGRRLQAFIFKEDFVAFFVAKVSQNSDQASERPADISQRPRWFPATINPSIAGWLAGWLARRLVLIAPN